MNTNKNVLISGAGIAGPSLAMWLSRMGYTPMLIEHAPSFREGGYIIDVWGVGYDLLERMSLLEAARAKGYLMERLRFVDDLGRQVSGFDADVFRRALHGRFFSMPRGDLARVIYDTVQGKIETLFSTSIETLQEDNSGVNVTLTNGITRHFDFVVGADGLRSRMRELSFGTEDRFERYLGYYAASFITEHYPRRDELTYVSFAKPGRQISRYALRGDRSAFLMVFVQDQKITARALEAHKDILDSKFGHDGWESPEILSRLAEATELYFDAVSQIHMPRWSKGRVVLIGDAAHCPSLLAGAGSAFAMLGAYILAGELARAAGDHAAAFAAYERKLRPFIEREQKRAIGFAGSFTPKTAFGIFLRNQVLNLLNVRPLGGWIARSFFGNEFRLPDYPV